MRVLCLLSCLLVASSVEADAATFYVSTAGSDAVSCATAQTIGTPKLTIVSGIACLAAGDTLLVRAGTYNERILSLPSGVSWANKVRIANYNAETVWIAPTCGGIPDDFCSPMRIQSSSPSYVEFDGINMDSRTASAGVTFVVDGSGEPHHIRLQNAEIIARSTDNGLSWAQNGIEIHGGLPSIIGGFEFRYLTIHGGGRPGTSNPDNGYGIYISAPNTLVEYCNIYDNKGAGIHVYNDDGASPDNNIIRNNRIHDQTRGTVSGQVWGLLLTGDDNLLANNQFYDINSGGFGDGIFLYFGANNLLYHNLMYGVVGTGLHLYNSAASNTQVANNLGFANGNNYTDNGSGTDLFTNLFGTDPLFLNVATRDFHLQSGSPARNTGTNGFASEDFVGNPRPQEGTADIGPYEFFTPGDTCWPVRSTFTGSNGTDLVTGYTGEACGTWTNHIGGGSAAQIATDRLRPSASGVASFQASGIPPSADYCVPIVFYQMSETPDTVAVMIRITGPDSQVIGFYYGGAAQRLWYLATVVNGTPTTHGTFSQTLSNATPYKLEVCGVGNQVSLYVNDVLRIGPSTTAQTTAGVAGIDFSGPTAPSDSTGYHIDLVGAPDVPVIPPSTYRIRLRSSGRQP